MIRKIKNNDLEILKDIIKREFNNLYQDNPYSAWLIYEENNKIIGFINYDIIYDKSEIEYIYVLEEYRRQNIASKLLNQMIEELNQKNIKNITLEVNENNKAAINFYKKFLFKEVAVRKNYYKDGNALLMLRSW